VVAVVPGLNTPVARLAAYEGDGPDPQYDAFVDGDAIRRAGELVPDGTTYYVHAPGASPLLAGNLKAAAQLFLGPALPVRDPALARWVVSYDAEPLLPHGLQAGAIHRVGEHAVLVEVRP
jgi:hypothetical protein